MRSARTSRSRALRGTPTRIGLERRSGEAEYSHRTTAGSASSSIFRCGEGESCPFAIQPHSHFQRRQVVRSSLNITLYYHPVGKCFYLELFVICESACPRPPFVSLQERREAVDYGKYSLLHCFPHRGGSTER